MPYVTIQCETCGNTKRAMQKPNRAPVRYCSSACSVDRWGIAKTRREIERVTALPVEQGLELLYNTREMTIADIADLVGVGRRSVDAVMSEVGIRRRTASEQKAIDLAKMSYEDRIAMTAASRAVMAGKKQSYEHLCRRAKGRQRNATLSNDEAQILEAMRGAGLEPVPLYAVEKYNIDFAFPDSMLAIEYNGGNWHNTPAKIESDKIKAERLSQLGWSIIVFPRIEKPQANNAGNRRIAIDDIVKQVDQALHRISSPPDQLQVR